MSDERRVVSVDDLAAAIVRHEAEGYRLMTISPADDPRRADMDGVDRIRLERAADAPPATGRAGMVYRDLVPGRVGGRIIASHIAIAEGGPVPDYVHFHDVRFQMIFCHAGWVKVVYEDQGEAFVMEPGDCVLQPPGIRHRVLESSDGLEVVELGAPAEHDTHRDHDLGLPTGRLLPDRRYGGQRFVRHVHDPDDWEPSLHDGWDVQHIAISEATDGYADVRLLRSSGAAPDVTVHDRDFVFAFVRRGRLLHVGDSDTETLVAGDAVVVPAGVPTAFHTDTRTELLLVSIASLHDDPSPHPAAAV